VSALTVTPQIRQQRLATEESTAQVDRKNPLPFLRVQFSDVMPGAGDAGVVAQQMDCAVVPLHLFRGRTPCHGIADIESQRQHLGRHRLQALLRLRQGIRIDIGQRQPHAALCSGDGNAITDSAGTAGDQRDPPCIGARGSVHVIRNRRNRACASPGRRQSRSALLHCRAAR
jgi:hypothetical protein